MSGKTDFCDTLVCQKCGGQIRYHIEGRVQCTICGAEMKWVCNPHKSDLDKVLRMMNFGHSELRKLVVGMPKAVEYIDIDQFIRYGYVGVYEAGTCECDFCNVMRRHERNYWLFEWRCMNDCIVASKSDEI